MTFTVQGLPQKFSFDRLYPDNWYTKVCDSCVHVWGVLEDVIEEKKNTIPSQYLVDISIGQLAFAKNCMHDGIKHSPAIAYDDLVRLSRIVGTLEERSLYLPPSIPAEKVAFLKAVMNKLHSKIELLLQANKTGASTRH